MNKSTNVALGLASALALSVAGPALAHAYHHGRHAHHPHFVPAPSSVVVTPIAPDPDYTNSDGLSRDNEDCNKGCIDKTN